MLKNVSRLVEILRTLNKTGVLYLARKNIPWILRPLLVKKKSPNGDIIKDAIYQLGPTFVKLGQMLSTREDIIGKDVCKSLEELQDSVPRLKNEYANDTINRNFGKNAQQIFLDFNPISVASASIAEVFKAKTQDGKEVAVKIIKPNVKQKINQNIGLFKKLASFLMFFSKEARRLRLNEVIKNFETFIHAELDFCIEAATISRIKEIHQGDKEINTPKVFWEHTSSDVLTMEWIEGEKVNNLKQINTQNINRHKVASSIMLMFFKQALEYGYFHADLHPGNILIQNNGNIALLDYGIIGHLSDRDKNYIARIFYGFMKRDYDYVAKVHFEAGFVPKNQSLFEFTQTCRSIGEPIIDMPASKISIGHLFKRLLDTTRKFQMEAQPQLLLLHKTMIMAEGIAKKICPEINLWDTTRPFLEDWAKKHLSFDNIIVNKIGNIKKDYQNLSQLIESSLNQDKQSKKTAFYFLISSNIIAYLILIYLLLNK